MVLPPDPEVRMSETAMTPAQITAAQITAELAHFTGTEKLTPHWLHRTYGMSDGAMFLAETAGAHWLNDAITSYQGDRRVREEVFQVWTLTVADNRAVLTMTDGDSNTPIVTQRIPFTDFPLPEIKLYLCNNVIYLPSEH